MKIGVFDSGAGGRSVAQAVAIALPEHDVQFRDDRKHVPYGTRQPEEILGFVIPIFESMIAEGCEVIVVACNTVTTTLIATLRRRFQVPLIGIEPMIKPAAKLTKSQVIAVCATPATLQSQRYQHLKQLYAQGLKVLEPDCSDWAARIEAHAISREHIDERINEVLDQGADVIVLGCTHYHWIETEIAALAYGKAMVLQPEPVIIEQLKRVLARLQ